MTWFSRSRSAAAIGLVLLAAACGDSAAPEFSDPAALTAELDRVDESFESEAYLAFSSLSLYMAPPGSPAAAALKLSAPQRVAQRQRSPSYAAANAMRDMIAPLSNPQLGEIIPDVLYGKAYEWDEAGDTYVESTTRTGPASGVRFYLYAINPITEAPIEPVVEVGYVDLIDESTGPSALALHVIIKSTGGTTHLDYTVSITARGSSFTAGSEGFISNGLSGGSLRRLDFDIAFSATDGGTTGTLSADATLTLNNSSVSLELHDEVTITQTSVTFTRDFRFHRPGETVVVQGEITITETSVTGTLTVRINGGIFVRATFTGTGVTQNRELSPAEQALLSRLLQTSEDVWEAIATFFNPAQLFAS